MENCRFAFIGCGNMARSLIGGLIANNFDKTHLIAADPDAGQRQKMKDLFDIETLADNKAAIDKSDVIVLAVKPQSMHAAIEDIGDKLRQQGKLIITIAAGIRLATLSKWLDTDIAIVRVMPNTPALIQAGAAALFANESTTEEQKNIAESMLRSVGTAVWLENEEQMDTVTALSGSGPAYFFYIMEAMENAAQELGLDEELARLLTIETAFGAAKMAMLSAHDPATLRKDVTSPGGTTESALQLFDQHKLDAILTQAMTAAKQRAIALSEELDK